MHKNESFTSMFRIEIVRSASQISCCFVIYMITHIAQLIQVIKTYNLSRIYGKSQVCVATPVIYTYRYHV